MIIYYYNVKLPGERAVVLPYGCGRDDKKNLDATFRLLLRWIASGGLRLRCSLLWKASKIKISI